jgi:hypothetical protein
LVCLIALSFFEQQSHQPVGLLPSASVVVYAVVVVVVVGSFKLMYAK